MTEWTDVLGNDVEAVQVLRLYYADKTSGPCLSTWVEAQSRELWTATGEHVALDWRTIAGHLLRDALHSVAWNLNDVADGYAQVVRCPDCGQVEVWSCLEVDTHGLCRSSGETCTEC